MKTVMNNKRTINLPIRPMKIPTKIIRLPTSKIIPPKKSIDIRKAVVAYLDVLGFSDKKDDKDIQASLIDFSGPLILSAGKYPQVQFNVFSDCAFISVSIRYAEYLLSAIRYAFTQWINDGILVRGGIALGSYSETDRVAIHKNLSNYYGNLFSGTAVVSAVKLEGQGQGALLFIDSKCAEFFAKKYKEPIFILNNSKIIGWSNDDRYLYWFVGISLLRLLEFLSLKNGVKHPVTEKLLNNIKYSFVATNSFLPRFLILAILSLPSINLKSREKAIDLLKIQDPNDFIPFKKLIDEWLNNKEKIKWLKAISYSDSSIPKVSEII